MLINRKKVKEALDWFQQMDSPPPSSLSLPQSNTMNYQPPFLVILGPSGSGKSTLFQSIVNHLNLSIQSIPMEEDSRNSYSPHSLLFPFKHHQYHHYKRNEERISFRNANKFPSLLFQNGPIKKRFLYCDDLPRMDASYKLLLNWKCALDIAGICLLITGINDEIPKEFTIATSANPSLNLTIIRLNSFTFSSIKKVIRSPFPSMGGDLRLAINTSKLLNIKNDENDDKIGKLNYQTDTKISIFHYLGKILYPRKSINKSPNGNKDENTNTDENSLPTLFIVPKFVNNLLWENFPDFMMNAEECATLNDSFSLMESFSWEIRKRDPCYEEYFGDLPQKTAFVMVNEKKHVEWQKNHNKFHQFKGREGKK